MRIFAAALRWEFNQMEMEKKWMFSALRRLIKLFDFQLLLLNGKRLIRFDIHTHATQHKNPRHLEKDILSITDKQTYGGIWAIDRIEIVRCHVRNLEDEEIFWKMSIGCESIKVFSQRAMVSVMDPMDVIMEIHIFWTYLTALPRVRTVLTEWF